MLERSVGHPALGSSVLCRFPGYEERTRSPDVKIIEASIAVFVNAALTQKRLYLTNVADEPRTSVRSRVGRHNTIGSSYLSQAIRWHAR